MSLRARLTLAGGGAVFVALVLASVVVYFGVRSKLRDQIDVSLVQSAQSVAAKIAVADAPAERLRAASRGSANSSSLASPEAPSPAARPTVRLSSDASGYLQSIPSLSAALRASTRPAPTPGGKRLAIERPLNGFVPLGVLNSRVALGVVPAAFPR
jgi:hypothetical protein